MDQDSTQSESQVSKSRSRLAIVLLFLIDGLSQIGVGDQDGHLSWSLEPAFFSLVLLGIDALLSIGLFRARRWALELARYRCILGVCLLVFLWASMFVLLTHEEALVFDSLFKIAIARDIFIGMQLIFILVLIRETKQAVLPKEASS